MKNAVIRRADARDAPRLAVLAAKLFRQTYQDTMPSRELEAYIAEDFGPLRQELELADPGVVTWLVETGGELVGYLQVRRNPVPPGDDSVLSLELWRIYLARECRGSGIGRRLLGKAGETARALGAGRIWLGVWEHNPDAIAFYERSGFQAVGSKPFEIGGEVHNDIVMVARSDVL